MKNLNYLLAVLMSEIRSQKTPKCARAGARKEVSSWEQEGWFEEGGEMEPLFVHVWSVYWISIFVLF